VKSNKVEKKETFNSRDSKNVMFMSQTYGKLNLLHKKEEIRSRHASKRVEHNENFSICESLKMTIFQGRISYISTYNTEIFNGIQLAKEIEEQVDN
jgi:hypothetical protein